MNSKKKVDDAVDFALGDRVKEMFHISVLAVKPDDEQYGHADDLLDAVTGLVSTGTLETIQNPVDECEF